MVTARCLYTKFQHVTSNFRHSMQADEDFSRSSSVVAIGLSRVVSLVRVLIRNYSDLCLHYYTTYYIIPCTNILVFYLRLDFIDEFVAVV